MTENDTNDRPPLPSPQACWDAGHVLRAARFDDIYFSRDGGLAEKRHVFLTGCGLPQAWRNAASYTVSELGFGTGLNFLATWDLWRRTRAPGARLHYLAVEGFPLTPTELSECHRLWPELAPLSDALLRAYQAPQPGFHRFVLRADDNDTPVYLTLLCGEAAAMLTQVEAAVDAWYLDGFAPDRNPDVWRAEVMKEIARLSHGARSLDEVDSHGLAAGPTRLATYTVAGAVRRELTAAGFEIQRAPGFGGKRENLRGAYAGTAETDVPRSSLSPWFARAAVPRTHGHAAVIGAGIAGCAMAHAMKQRGWTVTLIDRHSDIAEGASGNTIGLLMPRLTAAPSLESRFSTAAWRFLLRTLGAFATAGTATGFDRCGILQLAADAEDAARLQAIAARGTLPPEMLPYLAAAEASAIAGWAVNRPALHLPHGGCIDPRALCKALAGDTQRHMSTTVVAVQRSNTGLDVIGGDGPICAADVVILANGLDAAMLPATAWLPLAARRGQLTVAPSTKTSVDLRCVISYGGYVTPATRGRHAVGATFDWIDDPTATQNVISDDHRRNLEELNQNLPGLLTGITAEHCDGRAAIRCVTPDHLPVVGPAPDRDAYLSDYAHLRHGQHWTHYPPATYQSGLYLFTGLGARGLTEAVLAAELLACHITGEPMPLERDVVAALHPARFLVRDLKRMRA